MRRVQELLSSDSEWTESDREHYSLVSTTLKYKRLTFTWLDGEAQEVSFVVFSLLNYGFSAFLCQIIHALITIVEIVT